jgi:hypothetical protein
MIPVNGSDEVTEGPSLDYKELLKKYIAHIIDCEGMDYIERNINGPGHSVTISNKEQAELQKLAAEARHKYNT